MREPSNQLGIFGHGYTIQPSGRGCGGAEGVGNLPREQLFDHAARVGAYMQSRLRKYESHPLVGEVRGKGLIAAIELVANKAQRISLMAKLAQQPNSIAR